HNGPGMAIGFNAKNSTMDSDDSSVGIRSINYLIRLARDCKYLLHHTTRQTSNLGIRSANGSIRSFKSIAAMKS
ncbi:MAG TPA: hypothetical protein VFG46_23580, partial [Chryseolinea sp.]|nr:hypothetical protein [Chryseolinea sp.]